MFISSGESTSGTLVQETTMAPMISQLMQLSGTCIRTFARNQ